MLREPSACAWTKAGTGPQSRLSSVRSVISVIVYRVRLVDSLVVSCSEDETYSLWVKRTNGTLCRPEAVSDGGDQSA